MQVNIQLGKLKRPGKKGTMKKAQQPGTQGRKNKVLKRPIDLTGINISISWANVRWVKVRLCSVNPIDLEYLIVCDIYIGEFVFLVEA